MGERKDVKLDKTRLSVSGVMYVCYSCYTKCVIAVIASMMLQCYCSNTRICIQILSLRCCSASLVTEGFVSKSFPEGGRERVSLMFSDPCRFGYFWDHGSQSRSRPSTQQALRRIGLGDSD